MQLRPLRSGLSVARGLHADSSGTLHEWRLARVDLTRFRLRVQALPARTLGDVVGERSVPMAVNGGFFNHDFSPSGLLLSRGKRIAPVRRGGGSGILVVRNARAELVARDDALPDDVDFAMQCGPRLIERDGSVGIHRDDGKRAARTVACIREHGEVLDLIVVFTPESIGDGPTLFQLAERLSKPLAASDTTGCAAALNLDGGPSTGMVVVEAPELRYDPIGPVPFALAVEATTSSE